MKDIKKKRVFFKKKKDRDSEKESEEHNEKEKEGIRTLFRLKKSSYLSRQSP